MEDTIITYNTAKLAKEKGFDESDLYNRWVFCEIKDSMFYHLPVQHRNDDSYNKGYLYRAVTQSLLQKYLREVHKIQIVIEPMANETDYKFHVFITYLQCIKSICDFIKNKQKPIYGSYEEALEKALQEALKLIKI